MRLLKVFLTELMDVFQRLMSTILKQEKYLQRKEKKSLRKFLVRLKLQVLMKLKFVLYLLVSLLEVFVPNVTGET